MGTDRERAVQRVSKVDADVLLTLDLVLVTPVFNEVWASRDAFEWNGRRIQVVSRGGLTSMKRLAGRDQDLLDVRKLERRDDPGDE